ncbi:PAS domain S-box protein [Mesorhizobium atlanticum]
MGTAWIGERLRQARILALTREAHLQSIIDIVPEATIVIDGHGIIQSFSATAEQMFGYTAAEAIGNNVTLLMPSPYREEHDGYIKRYRDYRGAACYWNWPHGCRATQRRLDVSNGIGRRRDMVSEPAVFHGVHP